MKPSVRVVTVTQVGKPGTQAYLSMDAKAGDVNIKVSSVENISVGDKIRLDIDSKGHGIETVVVTHVGTQSVRNTLNGPLKDTEDPGTGLDLAEPLKFDHSSNIPFSVRGTGIREPFLCNIMKFITPVNDLKGTRKLKLRGMK